jgi:hypothetical protein
LAPNKANSLGHISSALRLWQMPQALRRSNVPVICDVHGDFVAMNRGADYVKPLVLSLRARTRNLTRHRERRNQATLDCVAHGAGQHRDYNIKK